MNKRTIVGIAVGFTATVAPVIISEMVEKRRASKIEKIFETNDKLFILHQKEKEAAESGMTTAILDVESWCNHTDK